MLHPSQRLFFCSLPIVHADDDFYEDIPFVTSVSNFPQKISEAPAAVTIITQDMILAAGIVDLHDIFHLAPGFDTYSVSGSFGGVNYGTYPNAYPNNLDIKLDGLSIYEVFLNTNNWNSLGIDVEDIKYVEVVRGANASVDGANSFTGSINIVTKSPLEQSSDKVRLRVGSDGERDVTLQIGSYQTGSAYQLTLKKRQNDGFDDFAGETFNDSLSTQSARFSSSFTPTLTDSIEIQAGFADSDLGLPGGGKEDTPDEVEPYVMQSSYLSALWRRELGESQYQLKVSKTSNSVEYYKYLGLFTDVVGLPPQLFYPDFPYADFDVEIDTRDQSSHRLDIEFRHNLKITDHGRFNWGLGHRHDAAQSRLFFTNDKSFIERTDRAFLNTEWNLGDVVTNVGAAYETTTKDESALSLRASLNYQLNDTTTLRLARNNVERGPSLMAANEYRTMSYDGYVFDLDRIAAEEIGNESNRVSELGIYSKFYDGALTLDAKLYQEKARDLIEVYTIKGTPLDFDRRIGYRDNTTFMDVEGAEFAVSYQTDQWQLWSNVAYRKAIGEALRDLTYVNGETVPSLVMDMKVTVPEMMGSVLLQRQLGKDSSVAVNYRFRDSVEYRLGGILPSASRVDMTYQKQLQLGRHPLNLSVIVHNVFDDNYLDYQSYNVADRRIYLRSELSF